VRVNARSSVINNNSGQICVSRFISRTSDADEPAAAVSRHLASGYYSDINLAAGIGEWTWRAARTLLARRRSPADTPTRLLRGACALSQRLTTCQNYFRFHFSRYIYDVLYDSERAAGGGRVCDIARTADSSAMDRIRPRGRQISYLRRTERRNGSGKGDK